MHCALRRNLISEVTDKLFIDRFLSLSVTKRLWAKHQLIDALNIHDNHRNALFFQAPENVSIQVDVYICFQLVQLASIIMI